MFFLGGCTVTAGDGGVDTIETNGIVCSGATADEALCREQFQNNAVATLKVSPAPGFVFTGWTVNGAQIKTASSETLFLTTMPVLAQHGDWVTPFTGNIANCQVNCSKVTITAPPAVKRDEIFDVTLTLIGGILGIALGVGGAWLITAFARWRTVIALDTILIACGVSAVTGLIFGLYPASQAARKHPIAALRYE